MQQTVDADANLLLVSEVIPACGSSFFCAAAADAEETEEAVLAAENSDKYKELYLCKIIT